MNNRTLTKPELVQIYNEQYRKGGGGRAEYHIPSHQKALVDVAEADDRAKREVFK